MTSAPRDNVEVPVDRDSRRGLENARIPVRAEFFRALGRNGFLIAGYLLLAIHVTIVMINMFWAPGTDYRNEERWADALTWSTILAPLLAMCALWIGELIRRGDWNPGESVDGDVHGRNVVRWRMLPLSIHFGFTFVSLSIALLIVTWTGVYPYADAHTLIALNGILAAGGGGAVLGSWIKKFVWLRWTRERQLRRMGPPNAAVRYTPGSKRAARFWRWFGFRWRLDLWSCAFGMIWLWCTGWFVALYLDDPTGSSVVLPLTCASFAGAGALLGFGIWATTQFWLSGEQLEFGESV